MRRNLPGPALAAPRNVEAALDELGIRYVVRDNEALAQCPHPDHDDRKPSWSCNLTSGLHNCFSCGFGGSFIRLVMTVKGMKRPAAEDWSRSFLRSADEISAGLSNEPVVRKVRQYSEADLALFHWPPAEALEDRALTQAAVQAYGVLWDKDKGAWILPVRDPRSRRLRGWQEKGEGYFKNVPYGLEKADCLFGYDTLKRGQLAVIVESPLDAVRLWSAGVMGAVATYGANFSDKQILLLTEVTDKLVDAFDDDDAGHKASRRLRKEYGQLFKQGLTEFDYGSTGAKDPGEMTDEEIRRGLRLAD